MRFIFYVLAKNREDLQKSIKLTLEYWFPSAYWITNVERIEQKETIQKEEKTAKTESKKKTNSITITFMVEAEVYSAGLKNVVRTSDHSKNT